MNEQNQKTPTSIEQGLKKRKSSNNLITSDEDECNFFSRFLVINANNHEPIKFSIFAIQKLLKCTVGDVANAKKLANGSVTCYWKLSENTKRKAH